MQKTIEDVKKEFDEKIFTVGNKLCAGFYFINFIIYIVSMFVRINILHEKHLQLIFICLIFTVDMSFVMGTNIIYKWKTKFTKHICITLSIILSAYGLCIYGDRDSLIFIFSCLAVSIVFLDSFFVLITGVISMLSILCVAFYGMYINGIESYQRYIWGYHFPFLIILIFTLLFVIACKMIRKIMLNAQIDEYEMSKAKKDNALASKIQEGFLNNEFPSNEVYDINACMIPSKDVGGDFYDFYIIDRTRLVMIVADVSGKGIPAALLMANAKTIIRDYITYGTNFEKSMETANRNIMRENKEMQFVTLFVCVVDLLTGKMNYINAGHVKPLVIDKDGKVTTIVSKPDFIFGVRKDTRYHSNEYMLNPGDKLFICTDGVTERLNVNNELYGKERLEKVLAENSEKEAKEVIPSILKSLEEYAKGREQNDDITCLLFNYKKQLILEPPIERDFDVSKEKVTDIISYIKEILNSKNVPEKTINLIAVASDEIISNVSKYAYDGLDKEKKININMQVYNHIINIIYTDYGKYFDPLSKITSSGTTKVTERSKIGGLGIQLTWNLMDKVEYSRIDDKNVISICKEY